MRNPNKERPCIQPARDEVKTMNNSVALPTAPDGISAEKASKCQADLHALSSIETG